MAKLVNLQQDKHFGDDKNLSIMSRNMFIFLSPRIWNLLVGSSHTPTKVQSLRLLTNLSTNDDMTGHVLTPQVSIKPLSVL